MELEVRSMDSLFLLAGITWCALDKLHVLSFATKICVTDKTEILYFLFYCLLTLKIFYFMAANKPFFSISNWLKNFLSYMFIECDIICTSFYKTIVCLMSTFFWSE